MRILSLAGRLTEIGRTSGTVMLRSHSWYEPFGDGEHVTTVTDWDTERGAPALDCTRAFKPGRRAHDKTVSNWDAERSAPARASVEAS